MPFHLFFHLFIPIRNAVCEVINALNISSASCCVANVIPISNAKCYVIL